MIQEREGTQDDPGSSTDADDDPSKEKNEVDEQSEESFPASDPPAY